MDFATFLVRNHWITKEECLLLVWQSMKAKEGKTNRDGFLEPSLQEFDSKDYSPLRPYPFGDVLEHNADVLKEVLKRSDAGSVSDLVERWHQWHVDRIQPISDYYLSPSDSEPKSFGRLMYENENEKRLCAHELVIRKLVHDEDHVIIPEGTGPFWCGLTALALLKKIHIVTTNGALVRELYENPKLRDRAESVSVIGGDIDVDLGGRGRGFVGGVAQGGFDQAINNTPPATVVISSVNGLTPDKGPYSPCPATGSTRYSLITKSLGSNMRSIVFVADHSKMRPSSVSNYGDAIFSDPKEWHNILDKNRSRIAIVAAPPAEIRNDATVMATRPRDRIVRGRGYSPATVEYLIAAAKFEELCSVNDDMSRFYEASSLSRSRKAV